MLVKAEAMLASAGFIMPFFRRRKASPVPETRLPACLLDGLVHAMMANGNLAKMAEDAIAWANSRGMRDRIELYRNIRDQVADYYAGMAK